MSHGLHSIRRTQNDPASLYVLLVDIMDGPHAGSPAFGGGSPPPAVKLNQTRLLPLYL
ncbi:hypothetical protein WJX79_002416 [Trebouxia sp. C0005]